MKFKFVWFKPFTAAEIAADNFRTSREYRTIQVRDMKRWIAGHGGSIASYTRCYSTWAYPNRGAEYYAKDIETLARLEKALADCD